MMQRAVLIHLAGIGVMVAAMATGLVACNNEDGAGPGKAPTSPMPPGPHIGLVIQADKTTHYQMLCDVRTYQAAPGQVANRYGVDKSGPFTDTIPSPNAHCTIMLINGPSVTVSLTKKDFPAGQSATAKDKASATITTPGEAGKFTLHMW
jgi:hypothetical protein